MARKSKKEIMADVEHVKARIIDNNTIEYYRLDGTRVIRLHLTDIVTFHKSGAVHLNTDGWTTLTTKDRINKYSPYRIHQAKSIWYVTINGVDYVYKDGISIFPSGAVQGQGEDPKKYIKLTKDINKYVKGFMGQLIARKIGQPGNGDCWDCSFKTEDGRSMGEMSNSEHILSHFKEKYYVPALLFNAIERISISQAARSCVGYWTRMHDQECGFFEDVGKRQVEKSLKRYLKRQLGMAA